MQCIKWPLDGSVIPLNYNISTLSDCTALHKLIYLHKLQRFKNEGNRIVKVIKYEQHVFTMYSSGRIALGNIMTMT